MTSPSSLPPDSSSSSPSPSPSLPFRPFSRLPTELLQHIIESTVSSHYHSTTYSERQTVLRSLCLVSSLFQRLSQPVLLAIASFSAINAVGRYPGFVPSAHPESTKELVVCGNEEKWYPDLDLHLLFATFDNLQHLVICKCNGELDLALLAGLSALSTLRLTDFAIVAPSVPVTLARLQQLQLMNVRFNKPLDEVFQPRSVPNLQALALYKDEDFLGGIDTLLDNVSAKLEMISLDHGMILEISSNVLAKISDKTLFDVGIIQYAPTAQEKNLRLYRVSDSDLHEGNVNAVSDLEKVEETLRTAVSGSLPSVLYLSDGPTPEAGGRVELGTAREALRRTAVERGVELVFEEQPRDWSVDSGISIDFWRRMKEQKNKDAQ